jgi:hypothetical protein
MSDVELSKLNEEIGDAESRGDKAWLNKVLAWEFAFRRVSGKLVNRKDYLEEVKVSSKRTTTVDKVEAFGKLAIVHCIVEQDGKRYRNIRLFIRQDGEWLLMAWANEEEHAGAA